ncbi:subtilisin-like protease SBT3.9 isoform X2 [Amborella trichopoda]|uniref:subtilisin-like protease SBT3.9 isoform X2 n=1 Tax=Amborella trichopoda TaxID=13333 RepID=UPI0005D45CB8|nr:subtilisin-like protease SBT3.9 isoform X2 [Amborella trichopoda]|eukprot:XP_011629200.1 subtilisin-like protease SBT3.9 isoform X2 [Amborella trichopoda]
MNTHTHTKMGFFQLLLLSLLVPQIPKLCVGEASNVRIVYLGAKHHEDPDVVRDLHHDILTKLHGSAEAARESMVYSYRYGFSGFAAKLTENQAKILSGFEGVVRVLPNRMYKLHTTRSWDFLGLNPKLPSTLLRKANSGDGVIVGVIDSGVWPESESFNDKGMGPIPRRWKGICQPGKQFNSSNCNRKLIGARWFVKGLEAQLGAPLSNVPGEILSARDSVDHGTHTASTAVGSPVTSATFRGLAVGTARGGAPLARLAVYKTAWLGGSVSAADMLKAFDYAIHDGVDVLSLSLGVSLPLYSYVDEGPDGIMIGAFHAMARGITVVCSGGNSGPEPQTVEDAAPWILTVAASTIDRTFPTAITLGNNHTFLGQAMNTEKKSEAFVGLVDSKSLSTNDSVEDEARKCLSGYLRRGSATGKVVLCFTSMNDQAAQAVASAGGIGVIFVQSSDTILSPCKPIPCTEVDYQVGTQILFYIQTSSSPVVKISHSKTLVGSIKSPKVATFSSRGPNSLSPAILKPDIAAPGVNILAAVPSPDSTSDKFMFMSGTSMACPHVAGIVALLMSIHPDWSPAAIKSALVTTASTMDKNEEPMLAEGYPRKVADPFDYGGGHVNPNQAADPGLIYDMDISDYILFFCAMGYNNSAISLVTSKTISCPKDPPSIPNMNLPSIVIPELKTSVTIARKVTNVGKVHSVYKAMVESPTGVKVVVEPKVLYFNEATIVLPFKVTFTVVHQMQGDYTFGSLIWSDGEHFVRSPIAVRRVIYDSYADIY